MSSILLTLILAIIFIVTITSSQPNDPLTDKNQETSSMDTCPTTHRHRKSWAEITQTERDLYISGFQTLASQGIVQTFTETHLESSHHSDPRFLPWHREFIYRFETEIRNIGGKYSCFTLPYWDSTDEPTPDDVQNNGAELLILNSGLGGNSNGDCLTDEEWTLYVPLDDICLRRDVDYATQKDYSYCKYGFVSAQYIISLIDEYKHYGSFEPELEAAHAPPHICIGGQMATIYSPDDPLFYLHHSFVDYQYALWQQCNHNHDISLYNDDVEFELSLYPFAEDTIKVKDTFDIMSRYDVSYEKGVFWKNADVDNDDNCIRDSEWFYTTEHIQQHSIQQHNIHNKRRGSNHVAQEILKSLKEENPDETRKEITEKWAQMVCEYEEKESGNECEAPKGYYDDCSTFAINEVTNDIDISLEEMIALEGITQCMIETRKKRYEWSVLMHQLKYLCAGCYDPFCDKEFLKGKCNDNKHNIDENVVVSDNNILFKGESYVSNTIHYMMYFCLIVLVFVAIFIFEFGHGNVDKKEKLSPTRKSYGAISVN